MYKVILVVACLQQSGNGIPPVIVVHMRERERKDSFPEVLYLNRSCEGRKHGRFTFPDRLYNTSLLKRFENLREMLSENCLLYLEQSDNTLDRCVELCKELFGSQLQPDIKSRLGFLAKDMRVSMFRIWAYNFIPTVPHNSAVSRYLYKMLEVKTNYLNMILETRKGITSKVNTYIIMVYTCLRHLILPAQ